MLLRRGAELTTAEQLEYLAIVQTQTERLIHLVDDLLVVARVEGDALVLEPEDVQIRPLLAQVVGGLGESGGRIELEEVAGAPSRLTIDPNRLIQILTNLAHNALKFSPDDVPVRIRWSAPADGTVVFEVIDRGAGIPPRNRR